AESPAASHAGITVRSAPQPLFRQHRSNSEELSTSICFPLCPQTRTLLDTFGPSQKGQQAHLRHVARASKFGSKKTPARRYRVFFDVRAALAWVARSICGGGCCSPAIAHQTLT